MPEKTPTKNQLLNVFVTRLIAEKGIDLDKMELAERNEMIRSMRAELDALIDRAMIASLSDDELAELERLIQNEASDEELDVFFANCQADYMKATEQAMMMFRDDFLAETEERR